MPDIKISTGAVDCCGNEEAEVITELKDFCARALNNGLKLFSLLDQPLDENIPETGADSLKSVMEWFLEYDPEDFGDPSDYIERDPLSDGTADLLSVAQTAEALIGIRDFILRQSQKDFLARTEQLISRATRLIGVYFLDESLRWFYDSLGDFNRDADELTRDLILSWREQRHD